MYQMGIDPTTTSTTAQFGLGQLGANVTAAGTKVYMYVQADGTGITGDGYVALVDGSSFVATMASTTSSAPGTGAGKSAGVARAAFAASSYGWLQVYGPGTVRVSASAAAYTLLNTTATAGQLDDDAGTGAEVVNGIVLDTANGGSAGTAAGWINWPDVGRTL
jgi:hypothetical protein